VRKQLLAHDAVYEADVDFGSKTATIKVKKGTPADQVVAAVGGQFTAKLKT
jgi:hypothetical protein